jgi:hypothetical protein
MREAQEERAEKGKREEKGREREEIKLCTS